MDSKRKLLAVCIGLSFCKPDEVIAETEFNTYLLDINDRSRIDLSRFSHDGYIMPGEYLLDVKINQALVGERTIVFTSDPKKPDMSRACLPADLVSSMALKAEAREKVRYWNGNQCADISDIKGAAISNQIGQGILQITIPQAWIKYKDANWTPPEQWDQGIPGLLLDYNLTGQIGKRYANGEAHSSYNSFSSYGTVGANAGSLRLRADYQAYSARNKLTNKSGFTWNQIYGFMPLPELGARLAMGEIYHDSSIFSRFRMTGASLRSDERMLPPSLQGFAPEVRGIAQGNAKITLSQDGRILYETTVPAGPFAIQDLNSSVRGKINVRIQEDNGRVTSYDIDVASIPYLTRPGEIRYNLAAGMPSNSRHRVYGQGFGMADISWGLSNNWSLYGGALLGGNYNALNAGVGVNLNTLGAISMDITHSSASLPNHTRNNGMSVRLQYSKRFDEYNSQITFAGYRFSQRKYMDMSQYLDARYARDNDDYGSREKQRYSISASKTFFSETPAKAFTTYLSYSHQDYWNRGAQERIDFSVSKMMNIGPIQDISISLGGYKSKDNDRRQDYGGTLNISVPLSQGRRAGYNMQVQNSNITQMASYSDYSRPNNNWQINAGVNNRGKALGSSYYTYESPYGTLSANTSYQQDSYASLSASMRGGATATMQGAALHRNGFAGSARIMVNTGDVSDVPVNNGKVVTNHFGVGVVPGVASYYDTTTSIDVNKLANDVEATRSVVQSTLTEGAIGYRNFAVVRGEKLFAAVRTQNGEAPPFGAVVMSQNGREVAVMNDDGSVYLTGVQKEEVLDIAWGGGKQCRIKIPGNYQTLSQLLLPCE